MKIKSMLITLFLLTISSMAFAGYVGPFTVVEGGWGSGDLDFGFESGDTMDSFPGLIYADKLGSIIIGDGVNFRIKIYNSDGIWQRNFTYKKITVPSIGGWPANLKVKAGVGIFSIYKKLQKYDYNGDLIWSIDVPGTRDFWIEDDGSIWLQESRKKYLKYSPTGQLLETYSEKPLELGVVDTKKIKRKKYRITIKYPDKTYQFMAKRSGSRHFRDAYNNLYWVEKFLEKVNKEDIFSHRVFICNACDDNVILFNMPQSQYEPRPSDSINYPTWTPVPIIEYGEPIVSPAGDIYCWARTKTEYKILKWTWQGDPDAPQSLKANSDKESLVLTWTKPVEDATAVKSYEIYRSSDVCGLFNKIKKVKKGVMQYTDKKVKEGETYYYQVCAERGSGYSGYSNRAAGKIGISNTTSMEAYSDTYLKVEKDILAGKTIHTAKLHSFNRNELKLLRNTIFAKHGRSFKSGVLKTWFAKKGWYKVDPNYSDKVLTNSDKKNITTFLNFEKKK
jgi:hypothetical protein